MRLPLITSLLALCFVMSCNETNSNKVDPSLVPPKERGLENSSILELDERLSGADSLVFVFYNDPQGDDSLRYTRYYKQYASIDSGLIKFVKGNLMDPTNRFERKKKCRSEGKIWCFTKGEIFQTIYFSSFSNDCSFLYIIKNGQFYYSPLSNEMALTLKDLQKKAIDPAKALVGIPSLRRKSHSAKI